MSRAGRAPKLSRKDGPRPPHREWSPPWIILYLIDKRPLSATFAHLQTDFFSTLAITISIDKDASNQFHGGLEMRWIAAPFAILLALAPTAAISSGADGLKDAPSAKARAIGIAFARCAVRQDRQAVMDFLFEPFGTNDPIKLSKALPSVCLDVAVGHPMFGPSNLNTSALLMRGLLFEALYTHDFRKLSAPLTFEGIAL